MPQRQDYILRLIDELREFVNAMVRGGDPGQGAEALHAVLHAQQQLFQRPPAEFLSADLAQQIDLLARGESPAGAVEKVATYAAILGAAVASLGTTAVLYFTRPSKPAKAGYYVAPSVGGAVVGGVF